MSDHWTPPGPKIEPRTHKPGEVSVDRGEGERLATARVVTMTYDPFNAPAQKFEPEPPVRL